VISEISATASASIQASDDGHIMLGKLAVGGDLMVTVHDGGAVDAQGVTVTGGSTIAVTDDARLTMAGSGTNVVLDARDDAVVELTGFQVTSAQVDAEDDAKVNLCATELLDVQVADASVRYSCQPKSLVQNVTDGGKLAPI